MKNGCQWLGSRDGSLRYDRAFSIVDVQQKKYEKVGKCIAVLSKPRVSERKGKPLLNRSPESRLHPRRCLTS